MRLLRALPTPLARTRPAGASGPGSSGAASSGSGSSEKRRVVTIGAFDGLHLGHREIVAAAKAIAQREQGLLTVVSFEPTPAEHFARGEPPARLTCFRERYELLAGWGVDELCCLPFRRINALSYDRFTGDVLHGSLAAVHVLVGHDFRYGAGRGGDVGSLRAAGEDLGFGVTVVDPVYLDGERISSTRIRALLGQGELGAARRMLGRDYSISGRIVHGLGLGRELGMPTANVNLKRRRAPVDGVFAVRVDGLGDRPLDGVASVGSRPTVGGGKALLEVHLFDFDASIYGAYISVRFLERLRAEEKFATLAALQAEMHRDVARAKAALSGRIA